MSFGIGGIGGAGTLIGQANQMQQQQFQSQAGQSTADYYPYFAAQQHQHFQAALVAQAITESKIKGVTMFQSFREYINKHRDIVFTLVGAVLVDKFFFGGKLQSRLIGLVERIVAKVESSLGDGK